MAEAKLSSQKKPIKKILEAQRFEEKNILKNGYNVNEDNSISETKYKDWWTSSYIKTRVCSLNIISPQNPRI